MSSFRCKILVFMFLHGFCRAPFYELQSLTRLLLAGWVHYVFNMLVRCDILDERKQCNLRELARACASKALIILRMSISRQRCLRNNLSQVINILMNCSNAKSNQHF